MPISLKELRQTPPVLLREISGASSLNGMLKKVITFFIHGESPNQGEILIKDVNHQKETDLSKKT